MSSVRAAAISIHDMRWLDKSEAMAYTHRHTDASFDNDFKDAGQYEGGKGFLYNKDELDAIIRGNVIRKCKLKIG